MGPILPERRSALPPTVTRATRFPLRCSEQAEVKKDHTQLLHRVLLGQIRSSATRLVCQNNCAVPGSTIRSAARRRSRVWAAPGAGSSRRPTDRTSPDAEGLPKRQISRCLKRYLTRETYQLLAAPGNPRDPFRLLRM